MAGTGASRRCSRANLSRRSNRCSRRRPSPLPGAPRAAAGGRRGSCGVDGSARGHDTPTGIGHVGVGTAFRRIVRRATRMLSRALHLIRAEVGGSADGTRTARDPYARHVPARGRAAGRRCGRRRRGRVAVPSGDRSAHPPDAEAGPADDAGLSGSIGIGAIRRTRSRRPTTWAARSARASTGSGQDDRDRRRVRPRRSSSTCGCSTRNTDSRTHRTQRDRAGRRRRSM